MNIADVKRELSGDEKVLEKAFKLETLYKKYKLIIWAVVIGLILFFVGKTVMQNMHEARLIAANEAFVSLQKNENDSNALAILKEKNPELFELFSLSKAMNSKDTKVLETLSTSSNEVVADISKYIIANLENKSSDSKIYNEFNVLQEAYLAIKAGDKSTAKSKLEMISDNRDLSQVSQTLQHATLKAK